MILGRTAIWTTQKDSCAGSKAHSFFLRCPNCLKHIENRALNIRIMDKPEKTVSVYQLALVYQGSSMISEGYEISIYVAVVLYVIASAVCHSLPDSLKLKTIEEISLVKQ